MIGALISVVILESRPMRMGGNIKRTLKHLLGQGASTSVAIAVDVEDGQELVLSSHPG